MKQGENIVTNTSPNSLTGLKVEYAQNPLGIDVEQPRFSWQMTNKLGVRGQSQLAYRIVVKNEQDLIAWDSGKISSESSLHIRYAGESLKPCTRYHWSVTVWDQSKQTSQAHAYFETGLMNGDISAWDGAQWIGGGDNDLPLYADYYPMYNLSAELKIAQGSTRAALILAANDPRLADKDKNIYQIQSGVNKSYFKVEIDIANVNEEGGLAYLNFYRAGYSSKDDPEHPIVQYNIKQSVINQSNKHAFHHLLIHNEYGMLTVQIDKHSAPCVEEEQGRSDTKLKFPPLEQLLSGATAALNPAGVNHRVISYGMLNDIGFSVDRNQRAFYRYLQVNNVLAPKNCLFSEKVTSPYQGLFADQLDANCFSIADECYILGNEHVEVFVVANPSQNGMPVLRSEFHLKNKVITKARLYVTARGIYEFYINGQRISHDYYNPGLTQYNVTHLYQTYDVSSSVVEGANAMGALLAEGWWSGMLGFGNTWNAFGDRQSLLAKLVVSYQDGSIDVITTNNRSWQFFNEGPITYASLVQGEVYDARKEAAINGWSRAGYTGKGWKKSEIVPLKGSATEGIKPNLKSPTQYLNYDKLQIIGQIGSPASVFKVLKAVSMQEVRTGVYVYDLGQNIVGVPRLNFESGEDGKVVTLRFSEMLYPDLPASGDNVGMILTENYRAALSQDIYIMKNGKQRYQPRFTSHGFQYIEITGINKALPLEDVEGVVISSISTISAGYETSNPKVNKLWSNIVWSNVDNFLSVPTDCPQRNERMGWSGDINVFARTATYISDSSQFFRRHLLSMRDTQANNGRYADISPIDGGFGGILWGSAGITLPWEAYWQFGDLDLLKENYPAMSAYIKYLDTTIDPQSGFSHDDELGDWLGPNNQQTGAAFIATVYHIYVLDIMAKVALILDKRDDAAFFRLNYGKRKAFFNDTFVSEQNKTLGWVTYGGHFETSDKPSEFKLADTQASYAIGLALGAFDDGLISEMASNLNACVKRQNKDDNGVLRREYSLMTGFISTAWIGDALSEHGYSNTAYRLIQNEHYPSLLYSVNQGASTIWERLNGYTVEDGFSGNNSMNSFNHYSFGAVGQWMMAHSAGIQRDTPGYKTFILKPQIDGEKRLRNVTSFYDSPYGRIESQWSIKGQKLHYSTTVPANTRAKLYLPAANLATVTEGGVFLAARQGILDVVEQDAVALIGLQSGKYHFISDLPH